MGATAAMSAMTMASAYGQSTAIGLQGKYQKTVSEINARNANLQAEDAIKRGAVEESNYRKKTNKTIGSQRAALAAQGIDINSGSAADILAETEAIGSLDAMTIRNNAFREAMGYKSQAFNYETEGKFADLSARNNARNTLISGGVQAASYGFSAYNASGKKR